jgi:hypothetical protein
VQGLTWVVNREVGDRLTLENWTLMQKATAYPNQFNDWIRRQGGIDVDASFIEVVVTGNRQAGVVITGMQAKVEKRAPPLREALFYAPPEAERENAQVGFNLDEGEPVARVVAPNKNFGDRGYLGREYFKERHISLDLGEKEVFAVVAMTSTSYYTWYIEMEVRAGGRTQYVRIDLRGNEKHKPKPFEISARADSRDGRKGSFAVYKELYVLNRSTNPPVGFTAVDSRTYAP